MTKPLAEGPTEEPPAGCTEVKAGEDIFATRYDASPGWSSGWFAHYPAVNVMEGGELTYVEAKDGKCDDSERYRAPDSFTTRGTVTSRPMRARTTPTAPGCAELDPAAGSLA